MADLTGIGTAVTAVGDAVTGIVNHFFGDKTAEEKSQAALELQALMNQYNLIQGQVAVDQTEAASTDRLQHWRGALGWVCVFAYAWQFVLQPIITYIFSIAFLFWGLKLPALPNIDFNSLEALTLGMLGLAGAHVYGQVKGAQQ